MTPSRPASAQAFVEIARTVAGGESSYARLRSGFVSTAHDDPIVDETLERVAAAVHEFAMLPS